MSGAKLTLTDFEAWCATNAPAHRVAGIDHAMWMLWCARALARGDSIPDLPASAPAEIPEEAAAAPPDHAADPVAPAPAEIPAPAGEPATAVAPPAEIPEVRATVDDAAPLPFFGSAATAGPIVAYTDGSGNRAHNPCGAGVVVYDGDTPIMEASRHLGNGTNNHAELSAVRIALYMTRDPEFRARELVVRSDSTYTIDSLTRDVDCEPNRPNAVLINGIRRAMRGRRVRFELVKGHSGVVGNERADELANLGRLRKPARPAADPE